MNSPRERVSAKIRYDETFTEKEIELIDRLITHSLKSGKIRDGKELFKALK